MYIDLLSMDSLSEGYYNLKPDRIRLSYYVTTCFLSKKKNSCP